ncbi:CCR4-NOT transcription complex subunit 4 [Astathelohania contejeani]|uniref:CCR4-NOT transcription complex subunit 4 n=1 Tax=Astathelohania contejeani TaxID=164912 RepID=A0ABQ7HXR6_9MICR|nr:CCR4-NOT transcription complex subunit 4 [Thelohania contejeani]
MSETSEICSAIETTETHREKTNLANVRVIQKNLVYIIGIPQKFADETLLRRHEFFGQFGLIKKLVVNKRTSHLETTASAYVTFVNESDATRFIKEVDESLIDGRMLKCTYGTTKYCSFYLKNVMCQNAECMYLHEPGAEADSLTKDEMCGSKHKLHNFEPKNRNIQRIGRKRDFEMILSDLYKYKSKKTYHIPDIIEFNPFCEENE